MNLIELQNFGRLTIADNWRPSKLASLNKLYFVYGGSAYWGDQKLAAGHLYLFPDRNHKNWYGADNFDHLYFDFFITPTLNFNDLIDIDLVDYPAVRSVCDAASAVFTEYDRHEMHGQAKALLGALLLLCDRVVPLRSAIDGKINAAIGYICAHPDEKFSIKRLADSVHLEKCYFIKLFKQETGKTPYRYACDLRLNNSVIMIENGATVREAAEASKFQSEAAFSGAFKKRFGISPGKIKSNSHLTNPRACDRIKAPLNKDVFQ